MTDSERVPRGKGEKKGETPNEIETETVCGQTERACPLDKEILITKFQFPNKYKILNFKF